MEKVALLEIPRYLTLVALNVFKTTHLFAVEQVVRELLQVVLETVQHQAPLVGITAKPQQLPLVSVLETISKALIRCPLITTIAILLLHLLQQHTPVQRLWVPVVVQALRLAPGLTATPAVRAEA